MAWNWQLKNWPNFYYENKLIQGFEEKLLQASGLFMGVFLCLDQKEQEQVKVNLLSEEALNTSAIEGEFLNRSSLQASMCKEFGLQAEEHRASPAEKGIARMMREVYEHYDEALDQNTLFNWHRHLMSGRSDLQSHGVYRTGSEPMLIVSGGTRGPTVHFEAPPSDQVPEMMNDFIEWFNQSAPQSNQPLSALLRAGIAHVYFESIHPFEDGNGRLGRALAEKALSQTLGHPTLIALSYAIEQYKKDYYKALGTINHSLDLTHWLKYFAHTVLQAQAHTQLHIDFLIKKAKFFDKYDEYLNERQRKVLLRMFREGIKGFEGGMSAENYLSITKTSRATATRDLHALLGLGALVKTGELRYTRYFLNLD